MNLQALANRVAHDHMHLAATGGAFPDVRGHPAEGVPNGRHRVRRKKLKEKLRAKAEEAHYLLNECDVPIRRVATRLRLSLRAVRLLRSIPFSHLEDALMRRVHRL